MAGSQRPTPVSQGMTDVMTARYDVIVIGSGIGGLAAAQVLSALGGNRVLVLEQHTRLGA